MDDRGVNLAAPPEVRPLLADLRRIDAPNDILDELVRAVQTTPQQKRSLGASIIGVSPAVQLGTAAAVIALVATIAIGLWSVRNIGTEAPAPPVPAGRTPETQMSTIRALVAAVNARDTDAFIGAFAVNGAFDPRGDFEASSSVFGNSQPIADANLVRAWMMIPEAWGLESELRACDLDTESRPHYDRADFIVRCEVTMRWHALSLEVREAWKFEFLGARVNWWDYGLLDINPADRALPLSFDGLVEWEAWLAATQPEAATRWLNPRATPPADWADICCDALTPGDPTRPRLAALMWKGERDWRLPRSRFHPDALIPYDPAFAVEISASIHEYLDGR